MRTSLPPTRVRWVAARASGTDTIIGDNGIVRMDVQGNKYAEREDEVAASTGGSIVDPGRG